jgi:hypothetical protein
MLHRYRQNVRGRLFLLIALLGGVGYAVALPFAYVTNYSANTISAYTINVATGALTLVAGSPVATGTNPIAITISRTGHSPMWRTLIPPTSRHTPSTPPPEY